MSYPPCVWALSTFPDPAPLRGKEGVGSGDFSRFSWRFKSCDTCLCACAFQQQARDPRTARIVSCPGGGVWVAVTREFERDNCVISEILQSDSTIPNRAGVPRKSTKVPRPSFVRESREGLGPRLLDRFSCQRSMRGMCFVGYAARAQLRSAIKISYKARVSRYGAMPWKGLTTTTILFRWLPYNS